jgi:hypothetical protein
MTIPRRKNQHRTESFDRSVYRTRNLIEPLINRMRQVLRVTARCETKAESYRAMWTIVGMLLSL